MHQLADLEDVRLEQAESTGHREHHPGLPLAQRTLQDITIYTALFARLQSYHFEAGSSGSSGIRPMRRVRHQDYVSVCITTRAMIGPHHKDPCKLTMRAGCRLQAHSVHARDFSEHVLQPVLHL